MKRITSNICEVVFALAVLGVFVKASRGADRGGWIFNPDTGHLYQLTATGLTWAQAEEAAVKLGDHLVTINDSAENAWILAQTQFGQAVSELWIGFYQQPSSPEPASGWGWVSGESVTYVNWRPREPNNDGGLEHIAVMFGILDLSGFPGTWNDGIDASAASFRPGLIELEAPIPVASEWGLIVVGLLTLSTGTLVFHPRAWKVRSEPGS